MEKIKQVLGGHSSHDNDHPTTTSSSTADKVTEGHTNTSKLGSGVTSKLGAGTTSAHHDPEVDAKEATSAAGNYPYWGDLSGEHGHSHGSTTMGTQAAGVGSSTAGIATSGVAAGAASTTNRESAYEHRPLGSSSEGTTTSSSAATAAGLPDRTREALQTSAAQGPSTTQSVQDSSHYKGEAATAPGLGAAGAAAYGVHRHDEDKTARAPGAASGPTSAGPGTLDPGYASQQTTQTSSSTAATAPTSYTNIDDTSYATREADSHKGALAAGAGAAGLAGAGYAAHKHGEDRSTTAHGLQDRDTTTTGAGLASAQNPTTGGGIHNTVVGAGSGEDAGAHQRTHKPAFNSSGLGSSHGTAGTSQVDPREQATIAGALGVSGDRQTEHNREGLAAAGAGAAGAGAVYAEEKHRHHGHDDEKTEKKGHSLFGSSHNKDDEKHKKEGAHGLFGSSHKDANKEFLDQHSQSLQDQHSQSHAAGATSQPAQLAAQQAWNKQNQPGTTATSTSTGGLTEAEKATSAAGNYPHQSTGSATDRSTGSGSAIGSAAGLGTAGAGAAALAAYGYGKTHDQNTAANTTSTSSNLSEAEKATSAAGNYPHTGSSDPSTQHTGSHTGTGGSAVGPAAGVGLAGAGATAAYYGQGKTHENNPRSGESEKIAERALGQDGAAHAPSSTTQTQTTSATQGGSREFPLTSHQGSSTTQPLPLTDERETGASSTGLGAAGVGASGLGGSGAGRDESKVVHKCHQCGADNDISEYFKKDAAFRMGS